MKLTNANHNPRQSPASQARSTGVTPRTWFKTQIRVDYHFCYVNIQGGQTRRHDRHPAIRDVVLVRIQADRGGTVAQPRLAPTRSWYSQAVPNTALQNRDQRWPGRPNRRSPRSTYAGRASLRTVQLPSPSTRNGYFFSALVRWVSVPLLASGPISHIPTMLDWPIKTNTLIGLPVALGLSSRRGRLAGFS